MRHHSDHQNRHGHGFKQTTDLHNVMLRTSDKNHHHLNKPSHQFPFSNNNRSHFGARRHHGKHRKPHVMRDEDDLNANLGEMPQAEVEIGEKEYVNFNNGNLDSDEESQGSYNDEIEGPPDYESDPTQERITSNYLPGHQMRVLKPIEDVDDPVDQSAVVQQEMIASLNDPRRGNRSDSMYGPQTPQDVDAAVGDVMAASHAAAKQTGRAGGNAHDMTISGKLAAEDAGYRNGIDPGLVGDASRVGIDDALDNAAAEGLGSGEGLRSTLEGGDADAYYESHMSQPDLDGLGDPLTDRGPVPLNINNLQHDGHAGDKQLDETRSTLNAEALDAEKISTDFKDSLAQMVPPGCEHNTMKTDARNRMAGKTFSEAIEIVEEVVNEIKQVAANPENYSQNDINRLISNNPLRNKEMEMDLQDIIANNQMDTTQAYEDTHREAVEMISKIQNDVPVKAKTYEEEQIYKTIEEQMNKINNGEEVETSSVMEEATLAALTENRVQEEESLEKLAEEKEKVDISATEAAIQAEEVAREAAHAAEEAAKAAGLSRNDVRLSRTPEIISAIGDDVETVKITNSKIDLPLKSMGPVIANDEEEAVALAKQDELKESLRNTITAEKYDSALNVIKGEDGVLNIGENAEKILIEDGKIFYPKGTMEKMDSEKMDTTRMTNMVNNGERRDIQYGTPYVAADASGMSLVLPSPGHPDPRPVLTDSEGTLDISLADSLLIKEGELQMNKWQNYNKSLRPTVNADVPSTPRMTTEEIMAQEEKRKKEAVASQTSAELVKTISGKDMLKLTPAYGTSEQVALSELATTSEQKETSEIPTRAVRTLGQDQIDMFKVTDDNVLQEEKKTTKFNIVEASTGSKSAEEKMRSEGLKEAVSSKETMNMINRRNAFSGKVSALKNDLVESSRAMAEMVNMKDERFTTEASKSASIKEMLDKYETSSLTTEERSQIENMKKSALKTTVTKSEAVKRGLINQVSEISKQLGISIKETTELINSLSESVILKIETFIRNPSSSEAAASFKSVETELRSLVGEKSSVFSSIIMDRVASITNKQNPLKPNQVPGLQNAVEVKEPHALDPKNGKLISINRETRITKSPKQGYPRILNRQVKYYIQPIMTRSTGGIDTVYQTGRSGENPTLSKRVVVKTVMKPVYPQMNPMPFPPSA